MEKEDLKEKAREMRRAYMREWNRKNKDKLKATRERYWMKKAREAEAAEEAKTAPAEG
mgnify:CR=1 FL=1